MTSIVDFLYISPQEVVRRLNNANLRESDEQLLQNLILQEYDKLDDESQTLVSLDTFRMFLLQSNIEEDLGINNHLLAAIVLTLLNLPSNDDNDTNTNDTNDTNDDINFMWNYIIKRLNFKSVMSLIPTYVMSQNLFNLIVSRYKRERKALLIEEGSLYGFEYNKEYEGSDAIFEVVKRVDPSDYEALMHASKEYYLVINSDRFLDYLNNTYGLAVNSVEEFVSKYELSITDIKSYIIKKIKEGKPFDKSIFHYLQRYDRGDIIDIIYDTDIPFDSYYFDMLTRGTNIDKITILYKAFNNRFNDKDKYMYYILNNKFDLSAINPYGNVLDNMFSHEDVAKLYCNELRNAVARRNIRFLNSLYPYTIVSEKYDIGHEEFTPRVVPGAYGLFIEEYQRKYKNWDLIMTMLEAFCSS